MRYFRCGSADPSLLGAVTALAASPLAFVSLPLELALAALLPLGAGVGLTAALSLRACLKPVQSLTQIGDPGAGGPPPTTSASGQLAVAVEGFRQRLRLALDAHQRAREDAENTERNEAEFLQSVSHELRTPLNAILGFSEVLLQEIDGPLTADQREDLEMIRRSGEHLQELVDDVLDLTAMQSGRFQLRCQPTDVAEVLREVGRLAEGQCVGKPVEIRTSLPEKPVPIDADPKRLRQIVTNLVSNAVKFTERGSVSIGLDRRPGLVRMTVQDTGPGIDASELRSIFEEFTQAGEGDKARHGSGLALRSAEG